MPMFASMYIYEMGFASASFQKTAWFYLHLFVLILSWIAPLLFSWYFLVPVYLLVFFQFIIFKRCLLNKQHGLAEEGDQIFYSVLFESLGLHPDRKKVKRIVRQYLYPALAVFAIILQVLLHIGPLLF